MARPTKVAGSRHPYARKVVPADVRGILGRTEFKAPLRGSTALERTRQHGELQAQWSAEIEAARAKVRGELRHLTHRDMLVIAGEWYRAEVAEHEDDPGSADDWQLERDMLADRLRPSQRDLDDAEELLRKRGIAADAGSVERLAAALLANKARRAELLRRRASGDYGADDFAHKLPTARPAEPAKADHAALPAETLLTAWAAERKPAPATLKKYGVAFRHVARLLGFDDVRRIKADDVVKFKAARLAEGRDPQTVADDVLAAGAVCKWAVTNRLLPSNPFAGLAPRPGQRGEAKRAPFTDAEAAAILAAARKEAGWQRWLPWLLAFSGARISEVAELGRRDVRQEAGTWIMDVRPNAARAGKNATFQRMVPLHPAVVAEGFLNYVADLPAGDGPLFPDLAIATKGGRGQTATFKHARWVRDVVGITDPTKAPAHSWRHRMEDELRKVRALPEVQDAITGRHNPRNAGAGYGKGFRGMPEETLKELARVPLPGGLEPLAPTPALPVTVPAERDPALSALGPSGKP